MSAEPKAAFPREPQTNLGFHLTADQDKAVDLLAGPQKHTLLRGGSRSGKTFLIVATIVLRALKAPGSRHAILRFRGNAAWSTIWLGTLPRVMQLVFPHVKYQEHKREGYISFSNGSEIWVGGLDDKERVDKILGMEFASLFFNETSQIPYVSVLTALTRLAQRVPLRLRAYYDCNPSGTGHYTYQLFKANKDPESGRPVNPDDYREMQMNPEGNRENIAEGYIEDVLAGLPEKQRRRFLLGEWSPEVEGALWQLETLDRARIEPNGRSLDEMFADMTIPPLVRCVVAVDPSGAAGKEEERSDEIGIVVAGKGRDGKAYVLADRTLKDAPLIWGRAASRAYDEFRADSVVAEVNYGGAMVTHVVQTADPKIRVKTITASRGKAVRAEPIAALFEKDMVRLVGEFRQLEEQMLNMSAAGYQGSRSPDRLDACVWALSELMLGGGDTLTNYL